MNRRKLLSNFIDHLFSISKGICPYRSECTIYPLYQENPPVSDKLKKIFRRSCLDELDAIKRWSDCPHYRKFLKQEIVQDEKGQRLVEYAIDMILRILPQECFFRSDCKEYKIMGYEKNDEKIYPCDDSLSVKERWSCCATYPKFLSKEIEKAEKRFRKL